MFRILKNLVLFLSSGMYEIMESLLDSYFFYTYEKKFIVISIFCLCVFTYENYIVGKIRFIYYFDNNF